MNSSRLTLERAEAANGRSCEELRLSHVAYFSEHMDNAMVRASTHLRKRLAEAHPDVDWLGQCDPVAPRSAWPGPPPYCDTREQSLRSSVHFRRSSLQFCRSSLHLRRTHAKPLRGTPGFGACHDRCTRAASCRVGTVPPWWRELHWPACAGPRELWIPEAFESELGRYWPVASNAVRTRVPDATRFVYAASALGDPSAEPPPL